MEHRSQRKKLVSVLQQIEKRLGGVKDRGRRGDYITKKENGSIRAESAGREKKKDDLFPLAIKRSVRGATKKKKEKKDSLRNGERKNVLSSSIRNKKIQSDAMWRRNLNSGREAKVYISGKRGK